MGTNYLKTKEGASLFLSLTEAEPESALNCLKRTVGKWSKEELLEFTTGRTEVVWALEKIAVWKDLFADAARLLLQLGEAENERISNNASGVFAGLFSPAPGAVAPTEASPQERFPVLKEALESTSKEKRMLSLKACDQALKTHSFVRSVGAEYQGLREEPKLWTPKTYGELFDAYRQVWNLLTEKLDNMGADEREKAISILLQNTGGLGHIVNLSDMLIGTLRELSQKTYADKKKILATVVHILHYEGKGMNPEIREKWEKLRDELTGAGFPSLMKRYVGMDLFEDKFDGEGKQVDQAQPQIEELAKQAVETSALLEAELPWLVTTAAQNGFRFGYELGKRDNGFSLMPILIKTQRSAGTNASPYFLGGYFRALFEKDPKAWEDILDSIAKDGKLVAWLAELTWRSGMSDRAATRLLDLAKKGNIGVEHFFIFGVGSAIKDLSEEVFKSWCDFFISHPNPAAISIALDLYFFFYIYKTPRPALPKDLTLRLLAHESLFTKLEPGKRGQMDDYHWTGIGKAIIEAYPEESLVLADKMLEHFQEDGTILEGFTSETHSVLNEITRRYPADMWEKVKKYLGPPIDERAFSIKEWLRGGDFFEEKEGVLPLIPVERIWAWVDEDVDKRAWYLATFVPKRLSREGGKICLAREILVRYGNMDDVRRNLRANFSTEGWSGPVSLHYENKRQQLLDFKKDEDNANVKLWIDEYVAGLEKEIKQAKVEEEREF